MSSSLNVNAWNSKQKLEGLHFRFTEQIMFIGAIEVVGA